MHDMYNYVFFIDLIIKLTIERNYIKFYIQNSTCVNIELNANKSALFDIKF